MMKAKVTYPEFRISRAAVGRRLASVILKAREQALTPEQFADTVNAVFDSCVSEECPDGKYAEADVMIVESEKDEIEKSVRRSNAARKAAAHRKSLRAQVKDEEVEENENTPAKLITFSVTPVVRRKKRRKNKRRRR